MRNCTVSIALNDRIIYIHLLYVYAGAFRLYDVDNDGYITREEMYNIVDAIYQMVVSNRITDSNRMYFHVYRLLSMGNTVQAQVKSMVRPQLARYCPDMNTLYNDLNYGLRAGSTATNGGREHATEASG